MRKKELVSWVSCLRRGLADSYALGVEDAKAYKVKRLPTIPWDVASALQVLEFDFLNIRWAYDAGYSDGTKERDAFEARRDEARSKRQWATGGPVRVTTWQIGENGPVSFVPNEATTPTTEESNDE